MLHNSNMSFSKVLVYEEDHMLQPVLPEINWQLIMMASASCKFWFKQWHNKSVLTIFFLPQHLKMCQAAQISYAQSRVAQRKRAGPITQRSMDRNHPLLTLHYMGQFMEDKWLQDRCVIYRVSIPLVGHSFLSSESSVNLMAVQNAALTKPLP